MITMCIGRYVLILKRYSLKDCSLLLIATIDGVEILCSENLIVIPPPPTIREFSGVS